MALDGGAGDDIVFGDNGSDTLIGGTGNDTLHGAAVDDILTGGVNNDTYVVNLGDGTDTLDNISGALSGDLDTLRFGTGIAVEYLSASVAVNDAILAYSATDSVRLQGWFGPDAALARQLNVDIPDAGVFARPLFIGTDGDISDDVILGTGGSDTLSGNFGSDTLLLGGGDTLTGGAEFDTLDGGGGDDTVLGGGFDLIIGGSGAGDDTLDGGDDIDTVTFASTTLGVVVDFAQGTASGTKTGADTLLQIENAVGGTGNDILIGDGLDNQLDGGGGNNTLDGGAGFNGLFGEGGDDAYLRSSPGFASDFIFDARGDDRLVIGSLFDIVNAFRNGSDAVFALDSGDLTIGGHFAGAAVETVETEEGTFSLVTSPVGGGDIFLGTSAADTLSGGGGDDLLFAGADNDSLDGGADSDTLSYAFTASGVNVDLGAGTAVGADIGTDTLGGIENATGGDGADTLTGDGGGNALDGGGNNTLDGGDGDVIELIGVNGIVDTSVLLE